MLSTAAGTLAFRVLKANNVTLAGVLKKITPKKFMSWREKIAWPLVDDGFG